MSNLIILFIILIANLYSFGHNECKPILFNKIPTQRLIQTSADSAVDSWVAPSVTR